ncbi:plasmid mobilization relaxosome protein MobC [Xylanimonas ulmi]|uniref:Mobilization protein MobC n=1 Tax=Xylanimonas ulmi TaxID=228973 RepID=A0A4Q7M2U5_9MICO|nr:plasmid mobilization relaxosome protein MobC [Xylanibacterium ulmi]RZS62215.1 mobilization protein MobC [Xylanibacterium ulmi]
MRVSDAEEGYLRRLALAHRVSVQRLLVESTMVAGAGESLADRRAVIANLFGLYRLAANIANNVNQIAKATNATGEVQAELAATLDAVRRVAVRIDAQIDELSLSQRGGGSR